MTERDKEYYNQKISELYTVIENQEKIIRELQTEIFGLNDRLSCANEEIDLYKSVIDEVRDYIEHEWFKRKQLFISNMDFQEWQLIKILEILDKSKGRDK